MIKIDGHSIEIEGDGLQLMIELANVIRFIGHDKHIIPKEMMLQFVDAAYMSDKEIKQANIKEIKKIIDRLENDDYDFDDGDEPGNHFKNIFGDILGDDYD